MRSGAAPTTLATRTIVGGLVLGVALSVGLVLVLIAWLAAAGLSAVTASGAGGKSLDGYFRGTITALDPKTKRVSLKYDFHSKEQLADWTEGVPFPVKQAPGQGIQWFDDRLEVKGNTGARHKAEWVGDIVVQATIVPDAEKDLGLYLTPVDDSGDFASFTLGETYFHKWDGHAGNLHSIIKFGKQWREAGSAADFLGFRYVDRRPPTTPVAPGKPVPLTASLVGGKLTFTLPDFELGGGDRGVKLKTMRPGFYVISGRMLVDDVVITGRLADAWLAKEGVELRTDKPVAAPRATGVDSETQALVDKYAAGEADAPALVKVLADGTRPAAARDAVAKALSSGPKKAVRAVLDLLYHSDVDVRAYGIAVVKGLLGKDYGFNPKGSEESRSAAVQKLNKELTEHPELLQG